MVGEEVRDLVGTEWEVAGVWGGRIHRRLGRRGSPSSLRACCVSRLRVGLVRLTTFLDGDPKHTLFSI